MNSYDFIKSRAQASRDAQGILAAAPTNPTWIWDQKTLLQWDGDLTLLDQLRMAESSKHTQRRNATELWQAAIDQIQKITRDVATNGLLKYRNDRVKRALFESLSTDGRSRAAIFEQGLAARDAWTEADANWTYNDTDTVGSFGSLLTDCLARQSAESSKYMAWKHASVTLNVKAEAVDRDNVHWYAVATQRYAAGTVEGDMIRSGVPTTSRPEQAVGQAVTSNLMVSGADIHFDVAAPHATRFTLLQLAPGAPAFAVVVADSTERSFTLHGQVPGLHKFKVIGSNSQGDGPESAVLEVTIAQSAVS